MTDRQPKGRLIPFIGVFWTPRLSHKYRSAADFILICHALEQAWPFMDWSLIPGEAEGGGGGGIRREGGM